MTSLQLALRTQDNKLGKFTSVAVNLSNYYLWYRDTFIYTGNIIYDCNTFVYILFLIDNKSRTKLHLIGKYCYDCEPVWNTMYV